MLWTTGCGHGGSTAGYGGSAAGHDGSKSSNASAAGHDGSKSSNVRSSAGSLSAENEFVSDGSLLWVI